MQPETGKIYEGKVTGITNFGAFVEIDKDVTGMVHISEVANTFVNEIKDHLTVGQEVKVKVLSVSEDGKISLSIKKASENPQPQRREQKRSDKGNFKGDRFDKGDKGDRFDKGDRKNDRGGQRNDRGNAPKPKPQETVPLTPEAAFEDMMNKWKQRSDERMGDIKKNMDSKRRNTSRKRGS